MPADRNRYVFTAVVGYAVAGGAWLIFENLIADLFPASDDAVMVGAAMDFVFLVVTAYLLSVALKRAPVAVPEVAAPRRDWRRLLWYPFAALATLLALWIRLTISPERDARPALLLFTLPIIVSAYLGGLGPGLTATAVAAFVADYFLLAPTRSLSVESPINVVNLVLLVGTGVLITLMFEALRRSRGRTDSLRALQGAIVASSEDAIVSKTLDGIVTSWNRAAELLFGYTAAEMIGQSISVIAAPGREDDMRNVLARVAKGETISRYQTQRRRKNGIIVDIVLTVSPVRDAEGKIVGASKIAREITDVLRAEAAQRDYSARLQGIVETAPDGIILIDGRGIVSMFNPAAETLFGYRADEVLGRNVKMLMPAHYAAEHDGYVANYVGSGHRKIIGIGREVEGRRKDGSIFPMHLAVGEIKREGGSIFAGIVHDLSAARAAEVALRRSQEHLARAQRVGHIGSAELDILTGQSFWSDEVYRLFGLDPAKFPPTLDSFLTVIPLEERDRARDDAARMRRAEDIEPYDYRIVRPDGEERWIHRSTEILRDAEGRPATVVTTLQDVTERRSMEQEARRSREHLARVQAIARIGSTEVDLATGEAMWSDEIYKLLGSGHGGIRPGVDSFAEAIHPDDREKVREASVRGRRGEETEPLEFRVVGGDGSVSWFYRTAAFVRDTTGRPTRLIATMYDVTARKAAEAARLASEEQYRLTFDQAPVGIAHVDGEGRVTLINESYCRILGRTRSELIGARPIEFTHPEDREITRETANRVRSGEAEIASVEKRYLRPDGEIVWCHLTFTGRRDASGGSQNLITVANDITKRKAAEQASRRSEQRFAAIFRDSPAGIIITDMDAGGRIVEVNEAWLRTSGYSRDEVIGRTSAELSLWADPEDREKLYRTLTQPESTWSAEVRVRRKDGTIFDYATTMRRIEVVGRPHLVALGFDVSQRNRLERERQHARDRFSTFVDAAPVAIVATNQDLRVISWNPAAASIFGYSTEEALGRPIADVVRFPEEDRLGTVERVAQLKRGEHIRSYSGRRHRKDGTWINVTISAAALVDLNGDFDGIIGVIEDVTERRKLEEQLVQAQKMEAVGQLTGGVAHDFNNLLMVMLGNLELIGEMAEADETMKRRIGIAMEAGKSGADLNRRLLAFSRRQTLEPETIDLNRRVSNFVPLIARTLGEAVEVRLKLAESVWPVLVDPGQFDSAILNLAVNARDAMLRGGWIAITTENVTADEAYVAQHVGLAAGDYVRVSVADSGVGMPPEVLARVFEPFFTTKEAGQGTGLGLSMVYGFIKQSGGNVTIYSEPGKGTVVRLLLPRSAAATMAETKGQALAKSKSAETILVVEDDIRVRSVTVSFLQGLGYRTLDTGSSKEAEMLIAAHPEIALLLSDVVLASGETGPVLAHKARQLRPNLRILFASGYSEEALERAGGLEQGIALLRKPFTKAALSTKVREALDRPLEPKNQERKT